MTDVLEMTLPKDIGTNLVSVVGKGRFMSGKTGKEWADPLSAWDAVGE